MLHGIYFVFYCSFSHRIPSQCRAEGAAALERQAREEAETRAHALLQQLQGLEAKQKEEEAAATAAAVAAAAATGLSPLLPPSAAPGTTAAGRPKDSPALDRVIHSLGEVQISPAPPGRAAVSLGGPAPAQLPPFLPLSPLPEACGSVERSRDLKKRTASPSSARQRAPELGAALAAVGLFNVFRGASADGSGDTIMEDNCELGGSKAGRREGDEEREAAAAAVAEPGPEGPRSGESRAL